MKKKLLFWEAVMIVLIIGVFLIIFSILNGWKLTGAERYSIAGVAAVVAAIVTVFAGVGITGAVVTDAVSDAGAAAAVVAAAAAVSVVAIAVATVAAGFAGIVTTGVVVVVVVAIATSGDIRNNKELKNPFAIISLILEALVVFGIISAITFLL